MALPLKKKNGGFSNGTLLNNNNTSPLFVLLLKKLVSLREVEEEEVEFPVIESLSKHISQLNIHTTNKIKHIKKKRIK